MMSVMKHYSRTIGGRIAGVPGWVGSHYFTDNKHEQMRIERHPLFEAGMIKLESDSPKKEDSRKEERSTPVDLKNIKWQELLKLCRDRGIDVAGRKKVELIKELSEE